MKLIFFIAALAGAIYLVLQTPAGKAWLSATESNPVVQSDAQTPTLIESHVTKKSENQIRQPDNKLNPHQAQIDQLQKRIAQLELELTKVSESKTQPAASLISHASKTPSNLTEKDTFVALRKPIGGTIENALPKAQKPDINIQRKRQAKLQDIAQRMEISSLQALVNE